MQRLITGIAVNAIRIPTGMVIIMDSMTVFLRERDFMILSIHSRTDLASEGLILDHPFMVILLASHMALAITPFSIIPITLAASIAHLPIRFTSIHIMHTGRRTIPGFTGITAIMMEDGLADIVILHSGGTEGVHQPLVLHA
jgi:hypothetical protein